MKWTLKERIYIYSFLEALAIILGWTQKRIDFCHELYSNLKLTKENSSEIAQILGKLPLEVRLVNIKNFNNAEIYNFVKDSIINLIIIECHNKFSPMAELQLLTLSKYLL